LLSRRRKDELLESRNGESDLESVRENIQPFYHELRVLKCVPYLHNAYDNTPVTTHLIVLKPRFRNLVLVFHKLL